MRYGVVSDIHANLLALNAVLGAFDDLGVDRVLCAGDIVGYGVQPNECIERLIEVDAAVVAGNHDLVAVGRLHNEAPAFVQHSTAWTRRTLGPDGLAYLAELPLRVTVPGVTLAHGSLHDPLEYVTTAEQAATQMSQLAELNPRTPVLILGHTHRAMAYTGGRIFTPPRSGSSISGLRTTALLNPGSIGQSRQLEVRPLARALVFDWPAGRADFLSVRYDTAAARRALRRHGLPRSGIHLLPGRLPGRVRKARYALVGPGR